MNKQKESTSNDLDALAEDARPPMAAASKTFGRWPLTVEENRLKPLVVEIHEDAARF